MLGQQSRVLPSVLMMPITHQEANRHLKCTFEMDKLAAISLAEGIWVRSTQVQTHRAKPRRDGADPDLSPSVFPLPRAFGSHSTPLSTGTQGHLILRCRKKPLSIQGWIPTEWGKLGAQLCKAVCCALTSEGFPSLLKKKKKFPRNPRCCCL